MNLFHSPYAVHTHPPRPIDQIVPQGPPGAPEPDAPTPTQAMSGEQINEQYIAHRQRLDDRLEAESRGFDTVFAQ